MNNNLLWHYTDINGLLGIFSGRENERDVLSFHGSSVYSMNDYKEVDFGLSLFESAIKEEFSCGVSSWDAEGSRFYKSHVEPILWQISKLERLNLFSVSFSQAGDQLSQWRGYADAGYAIGMDSTQLMRGIDLGQGAAGRRRKFGEVVYFGANREKNIEQVRKMDDFKSVVSKIRGDYPVEQVLDLMYWSIMVDLPFWKSAGFSEEQEVRYVLWSDSGIKYKPSQLGPRAYTELTVPLEAVKEVMVGPGRNVDERFTTTNRFVQEKTSGRAYASTSRVTFRS